MKSFDVFISYTTEDDVWCVQLAEQLCHHGLQACLEKRHIPNSFDLDTIMEKGLVYGSRIVLVLTPTYLTEKKNWAAVERRFFNYQQLTGHKQFAIPVLLKDCKFPPFLREFQYLDFRDPLMYQFNLDKLVAILKDTEIDTNTSLTSSIQSTVSHESRNQKKIVTIGGTFDTFHKGHKEYVRLAFEFADYVVIYMNSDEYARGIKDYSVRPYEIRISRLKDFIQEIGYQYRYEIRCLNRLSDLEKEFLEDDWLKHNIYMSIIVPEYYDFFLNLNKSRDAQGLKSFFILVKLRSRDHKKGDFSSSSIRYHGTAK